MATAIDNLGRKIDSTNMSLGDIKSLIGTLMKSKVGAARPVESKSEGTPNGDIAKVRELMEQYTKDFAKEMQEQRGFLSDVVDNLKDLVQQRVNKRAESPKQPKKEKKEKPVISKEEKIMAKSSEGLYKTFAKKGSGYTHDIYVEKAIRELCHCIKGMSPKTPSPEPNDGGDAGGGGGSGGNTGGGGTAPGGGGKKKEKTRQIGGLPIADDLAIISYFISQITGELAKVEQHVMGFNTLHQVFKGMVKEEREIVQNMRAVGYETAGATKESMSLLRSFEDIGSSTKQTGVDRDVFQKTYLKALKHGIKDLKVAANITKSQLNTEKQLGMEAGSLSDEFVSWNKAGRMTIGQIADMGRGMREVARNTGMTGDELAGVVKGSKEFIDSLRNAATLSTSTAKNIIEIGANAKKLGIDGQMQPLMKAMSSSSNLILEASSETKALLFTAAGSVGRIDELMNGTILRSKAGIKDMAKGIDNVLKRFGVESMDAIDQLSDDAKMRLNVSLKATFGIELGELRSQYEALNEAGKGMAERLADINKKRQQNLTLEEKAALMEDERRLKTSKSLEVLTALDEAAKGAKDMNQALATFGRRRSEFEEDLSALGQTWTSEADIARGAIQNAMDSINAGLKKAGKQEIAIDSSDIERALKDPAAMRELTSQISKGEQELATAQKAQLDPLTEMQQSLNEINDNIRNFTNKGFSVLFNSLIGKIAVIGAAITGVVGGISLLTIGLISKIDSFKRVLKEMDDRGGIAEVIKGVFKRKQNSETGEVEKSFLETLKGALGFGHEKKDKQMGEPEAQVAALNQKQSTKAQTGIEAKLKEVSTALQQDQDIFPLMLDELKAIRKCICTDKSKLVSDKAAGQAKAASMSQEEKSQARIQRKLQKSNQADANTGSVPTKPATEKFDVAGMMSSGKDMMKAAAAVLLLGVGIIALGAAIVFLSSKIMSAFKLDVKTVLETASIIGAVALAGGAIAAAGVVAFEALNSNEMKSFNERASSSYLQILKSAAALLLIGPAIVLLGGAIVAMTGLILSKLGLSLGSVAETAAVVVAVAGVAGAMALGASEFIEGLDKLKENKTWNDIMNKPGQLAKEIGKTALALLLVGGAIMGLGIALVKMGQIMMSVVGLDGATAAKIGMQVAGLIVAAGAIAGAVIGASFALSALGKFAEKSTKMISDMLKGAVALAIMTPAIVALASGVVWISKAIMGAFGLDSGAAAKTAMNIAELLLATGFIALAVIGASAGLFALGTLAKVAYTALPLMALGAGALLLMAPAITALAAGVVAITQKVMGAFGLDSGTAAKAAKDLAGIIASAGFIALAVMGTTWGLSALASLVLTGAVWPIIGMAAAGGAALLLLTPAIAALASGIIYMAQAVMKNIIDPSEATKVSDMLADIIGAAASISISILGMGAALAVLGLATASGLFFVAAALAVLGAAAMVVITPAVVALNTAIISMAQEVMKNVVSPDEAKATSEALASILQSAASISWSVIKSVASLGVLGLMAGFSAIAWVVTGAMWLGTKALQFLTPAVISMANTIIKMAGGLITSGISSKDAKGITEGLSSILESAGKIADSVINSVSSLSKLGAFSMVSGIISYFMWAGVKALEELSAPVKGYIEKVVEIAKSFGSALNPSQAVEMSKGVAQILSAAGEVTDMIVKTKERLMSIKTSEGFWFWSTDIVESMWSGVIALNKLKNPVIAYVGTIVSFAKSIGGKVNVGSAKEIVKSLTDVSTIITLVSKVMNDLSEKIVPLTQGGWFTASPIKQMTKAKGQMEVFFPAMVDFVKTIVDKVRGSMGDTKELKTAAKGLQAMAMILNAALPSISIMSEKIAPLTQGGWFSASPVDKIKAAIPQFKGFFETIGQFVNSIVTSTETIKDTSGLKESAKKMIMLSSVLDSTSKAIGSVAMIVGLMDDGWFTKSPVTKIIENKNKFAKYFGQIAEFVNTGIVFPINNVIPDATKLNNASTVITQLARLLCGTKITLESLASVIGLMEPKSFFQKAPLTKIMNNKDQFKEWFISIAEFVNTGIVKPVNDEFKDPSQILGAAKIVNAMATVASSIVPMIKNLAAAIALGTDSSSFFADTPISKILKSKDDFAKWFQSIAIFMRDGIVNPINTEMAGVDISGASKTITAMANIAANIVPIIKNLSGAMSLMSSPAERYFDTDFPIDKIMVYKDEFARWFKSISIFMRDGIVFPILTELPEPRTIMMASQILSAMGRIVTLIPTVINNMANGLIPLIDSGMSLTNDTAKEKIDGKTKLFGDWFTSIAAFMRDGIVFPILNELPEPQTIMMATKILSAMGRIFILLPTMIRNLSSLFVPLDPSNCLKDAPIQMLAGNTQMFGAWFNSITSFVRDGILYPILNNLPTAEEITAGMSQLSNMSKGIDAAEMIVSYVSERMNSLSINPFWALMASWKASLFGNAFMGMANAINDGILQPMKLLPPSSEIDEVVNQLDGMTQALYKVEEVLGAMDFAMKSISNSKIDFSALDKIPIQKMAMFASAMKDMTAMTSVGNTSGGASGAGGAGTPSEKAIETQLLKDQTAAQQTLSTALGLMVNEAMTGDGLFVRDRLAFKNQNDMIKIQKDEAKSTIPITSKIESGIKTGFGNAKSEIKSEGIKTDFKKFKPAIQSVNPKPVAGNIDMRRASESMQDTPIERALANEARERNNRNPYTDRRAAREQARRARREQSGFGSGVDYVNYNSSSVSSAEKIASQGIITPESNLMNSLNRAASQPTANGVIGTEPEGTGVESANVKTVAKTSAINSDMHSAIASDRASTSPDKTEITSPELGAIASEAGDHNAKLDTLITLFQQVLDALKPKSTPITSGGGIPSDTSAKTIVHKPANFFKNPVGLVTQANAKSITNIGSPRG